MKILLTGGNGMVGRNILHHPFAQNFNIFSPSRLELDLCDKYAVRYYLETIKPDLIIHAAGRVGGIHANIRFPYEFLLENMEIGLNIIDSAANVGIPRLINLSSSCIYPNNVEGMLTEDMILGGRLEPTNEGYALAKIAALRLCEFASKREISLHYKTLIPCNLYGPHDKFDLNSAHLIPAIINKIHQAKQQGESNVEIWGDGSARREFMYIEDLVIAIFLAIQTYDQLPSIINIGLGQDHTILDYYHAVAHVMQWEGNFTFNPSKPTGMKRKLLNVDRQIKWGFKPVHALSEGIRKTYDFYLKSLAP
jgi:GDP-L-fucose synthase